jgi:hypothetical protein
MLDRRDNIQPPHAKTCRWIFELEKYKSWRSQSNGLLWIKGKAGAGKSTLMLSLHEELNKPHDGTKGIRVAFFFTARGAEMQCSPLGMFRSLLHQMFIHDKTAVRPQVREIFERRCREFGDGESTWKLPEKILQTSLADAILKSATLQEVTVFVDALDETGAESAQEVAAYFHRLNDHAEKARAAVKICVSCRHYPIVSKSLATEIAVEQHNSGDITAYIKDNLLNIVAEEGLDCESWQGLVDELIQQANGMGQYHHTAY